ncbi:MAG: sortase [Clostridia bacterium]|nr:sortase [Clostridia bacterium]
MNQILVNEKVYVTPKLRRKKRFYKIQFVLSILVVIVLTSYYVYSEYEKRKGESISQDILNDFSSITVDNTVADDDTLVIALNENAEEIPQNNQPQILDQFNTVYKTSSGTEYKVDSILNIPSLEINYPVLSDSSTELLKISLNKFWGGEPNSVGNYCVVGHNYDGKDIFFGKLHKLQNGDVVELQDKTGKLVRYKVYNKFVVQPTDVACTSQLTNGKVEMTLITCSDGGKTRLVVKCRAVE